MRVAAVLCALGFTLLPVRCPAEEPAPGERAEQVVNTAGGEAGLLRVFRFRERLLITDTPAPPVAEGEAGNRSSVVEVGGDWWIGAAKRDKEKVRILCRAWSLRLLLDPRSVIEALPSIEVAGRPAFRLRVTGSVAEPIDLSFDDETSRLVAIDYDDTRHLFSDWKRTERGHWYPAHVAGYRFQDRAAGTLQETQWYQTDILELVPLDEVPAELRQ